MNCKFKNFLVRIAKYSPLLNFFMLLYAQYSDLNTKLIALFVLSLLLIFGKCNRPIIGTKMFIAITIMNLLGVTLWITVGYGIGFISTQILVPKLVEWILLSMGPLIIVHKLDRASLMMGKANSRIGFAIRIIIAAVERTISQAPTWASEVVEYKRIDEFAWGSKQSSLNSYLIYFAQFLEYPLRIIATINTEISKPRNHTSENVIPTEIDQNNQLMRDNLSHLFTFGLFASILLFTKQFY